MTDISIARELASLEAATPLAASDLIRELLKFHKATVDHERYVFLSGQVISRSRQVYEEINAIMLNIRASKTLQWDLFDTYTRAIPPLERILLSLYFKEPQLPRKHVPDNDDVVGGLAFIDLWVYDRQMLIKALNNLRCKELLELSAKTKAILDVSYEADCSRDDEVAFAALVNFFQSFAVPGKLRDNDVHDRGGVKPVTDVRIAVRGIDKKLKAKPPTEAFAEMVLKSLMLLTLPFSLLDNNRSADRTPLNEATREHLSSIKVWGAMRSFVLNISTAAENSPTEQVLEKLEAEFQELRALLLSISEVLVETVEDFISLIELSTRIRSPFHERTVGLIRILRYLDEQSAKNKASNALRRELKDVLQKSAEVLKETEKAVTDVKSVILSGPEYAAQKTAFNTLLGVAENCSTKLGLENEWSSQVTKFTEGVTIDESHLNQMRSTFMGEAPS